MNLMNLSLEKNADWKSSKLETNMENQELSASFLSILRDLGLVLWSEIIGWNLLSNKSYRNIEFDTELTIKNTSNAHLKAISIFET
jgi:hypothetical protein